MSCSIFEPVSQPAAQPAPQPAVSPVIDYEPPAFGGPVTLPPVTARPERPRGPVRAPAGRGCPADDARTRTAAIFADAALRRILEVIDRRRPPAQLRPLMAAGLADSLPAAGGAAPARLRRVVAQLAEPDGSAAEVAACYTRADRLHAIACRIEQIPSATGPRWRVVALHMG
jgi:hypothetical protein